MNTPALAPQAKRRHRPRTGMGAYVTDKELYEYLGVPEKTARPVIAILDRDRQSHFPPKIPLWGDRRYLPAVEAWLERNYGLKIPASHKGEPE